VCDIVDKYGSMIKTETISLSAFINKLIHVCV